MPAVEELTLALADEDLAVEFSPLTTAGDRLTNDATEPLTADG